MKMIKNKKSRKHKKHTPKQQHQQAQFPWIPKEMVDVLGSSEDALGWKRLGYTPDEIRDHSLHRLALYDAGMSVYDLPILTKKGKKCKDSKVDEYGLDIFNKPVVKQTVVNDLDDIEIIKPEYEPLAPVFG